MTKKELINTVAEKANLPKYVAADAVSATTDALTEALARGEKVLLPGFGVFETKTYPAHEGFNPKTKEPVLVQESHRVIFRNARALKNAVAK